MDLFSVWHLLILLAIVLVLFGTSKIKNIGSDLGGAIRNFKQAVKGDGEEESEGTNKPSAGKSPPPGRIIDAEAEPVAKSGARSSSKKA